MFRDHWPMLIPLPTGITAWHTRWFQDRDSADGFARTTTSEGGLVLFHQAVGPVHFVDYIPAEDMQRAHAAATPAGEEGGR